MTKESLCATLLNLDSLPHAADEKKVLAWRETLKEALPRIKNRVTSEEFELLNRWIHHHNTQHLLEAIFGNSPFLSQILIQDCMFFASHAELALADSIQAILNELRRIDLAVSKEQFMEALRLYKRRMAWMLAVADLSGKASLEDVVLYLSDFADLAVSKTIQYLLYQAHQQGIIVLTDISDPEKDSGLIVLALGKLGAREVNYSSDVDLVVFFEEGKLVYNGKETLAHFYIKLTQAFTSLLQDRTRDGYVFRVDLRLRPDPSSTPVAINTQAAEVYYEQVGQNWERAAMIKARQIAGDKTSGEKFLKFLHSYVWRKYLDFASIRDIHSIKRQIDAREGMLPDNLLGYNLKLGRGGIREIEFFAQTQQLIWGGREPKLRTPQTVDALCALANTGHITRQTAETLTESYRLYRTLEHRLQMVDDQQTHSLPDTLDVMQKFAVFSGYNSEKQLIELLTTHLKRVQEYYAKLFDNAPSLANPIGGSLVFTGTEHDPETLKTLSKMGFESSEAISEIIRGWHFGRRKVTSSKRAREVITEITPHLLLAFSKTVYPDQALLKFDEFLSRLPGSAQIFSLIYENMHVLDLLAEIMGDYPYISESLSRKPSQLEYVLLPEFYHSIPNLEQLIHQLNLILEEARDYQDILDFTRRFVHDQQFRVGIQLIRKQLSAEAASAHLSDIAEAMLSVLMKETIRDFSKKHGTIHGSQFGILMLGKLGSRELSFGSDLDLIFVYEVPTDALETSTIKLSVNEYFIRLSRHLVSSISALTPEGKLFDVDLRLRPSGNEGSMATSLEALKEYYASSAWAWEYMALTRGRVISLHPDFSKRIENETRKILSKRWDLKELVTGILDMKRRVEQEFGTRDPFQIKYVSGGMMDLEYLAQFLQLKFGAEFPDILSPSTKEVFDALINIKKLAKSQGSKLKDAATFYQHIQMMMRLSGITSQKSISQIPESMQRVLLKATELNDFQTLTEKLQQMQKHVQNMFETIISDS